VRDIACRQEIERAHPCAEIRAPEVGERFNYVVLRKYPWIFDMRGRKINIKIGDKYEYYESLKNEEYKKVYCTINCDEPEMAIDIDYYITHEIIGQFARFLTYHPDYDKFYNNINLQLSEDEAYKAADKDAHKFAKKKLTDLYNTKFAKKYESRGKLYQGEFRKINALYKVSLEEEYGDSAVIFSAVNTAITNGDNIHSILRNELLKSAEKLGKKNANTGMIQTINEQKLNPFDMYCKYVTKGGICDIAHKTHNASLRRIIVALGKILPDFEKLCESHIDIMQKIVYDSRKTNGDDNEILSQFSACHFSNAQHDLVVTMWDLYNELSATYQCIHENNRLREELSYLKSAHIGAQVIPPSVKLASKDELKEWFNKNN
jgi:hypothetical protein